MQIVIDIPEEVKNRLDFGVTYTQDIQAICEAVGNSTPLTDMLYKIRAEIDVARFIDKDTKLCKNANASGLEVAMKLIDKYRAEGGR